MLKNGQTKPCVICGTEYYRPRHREASKYCSYKCARSILKYSPEQRVAAFWAKVDKSGGEDACWPWQGAITSHGYGCVSAGGYRVMGAHKVAYEFAKGEVPAGMFVMHSCDNPPCCNPAHLIQGTRQDNMSDMAAKGRGTKSRRLILTTTTAREIKDLRGKATSGEIAKQYGISQSYVFALWAGRCWRTA